jgi:hypothetical protein
MLWTLSRCVILIVVECVEVPPGAMNNSGSGFDTRTFLTENNFTVNFDTFVTGELKFTLKTINFRKVMPLDIPDCYKLHVKVR